MAGTQVHKKYVETSWIDFAEWGIDLTRGERVGQYGNLQTRFRAALKESALH